MKSNHSILSLVRQVMLGLQGFVLLLVLSIGLSNLVILPVITYQNKTPVVFDYLLLTLFSVWFLYHLIYTFVQRYQHSEITGRVTVVRVFILSLLAVFSAAMLRFFKFLFFLIGIAMFIMVIVAALYLNTWLV